MEWSAFWSSCSILFFNLILAHKFPCDVDFESRIVTTPRPRTTLSPEHSFALLIVTLYGNKRILDGPICLMDGTCVNIVDSAMEGERGITFIRDISTQELQITTMNLKLPRSESVIYLHLQAPI
ncbi:hypothetical protein Y032_0014g2353 [Ancylostoma ceylanicum]|uniref:Receptor L-domain domain-containing protein n=1 Tax=Ancylostoma ceylanicum TaxID=53326 RepID=A0A016VAW0_9BILA|nr:hypothetical protein Y032_0014g2353 [Ancylostoma ceylanicum]